MMAKQQYVWLDGKFVKWEEANVHLLTHSMQYGSGMFEGIRSYETDKGAAVFRLSDHIRRFTNSIKIYGMPCKFTQKQLEGAVTATIAKNGLTDSYIRPFIFYKDVGIGFNVKGKGTSVAIMAVPFGSLFEDHMKGLRCKTSTWLRINSGILPSTAKASGNYLNSLIASQEANNSGYDETIMLTNMGMVAEGPGENIFVVQDNVLITPPKSADILVGITRDAILKLAEHAGIKTEERDLRKDELYTSDEVFFTGTAAEVTPIVSVDSRIVGAGKPGPITLVLADKYSKTVHGKTKEFGQWLTYV